MVKSKDDLFSCLKKLGIETKTTEHVPLFTVEESKRLRGQLSGGHCKNLFLRDAKKRLFLLVCLEDTPVDLKQLHVLVGCKRLSFSSAERLYDALGVTPGSVTPFAVINDEAGQVSVLLDHNLMNYEHLNFHPLTNEATTQIKTQNLLTFLDALNHTPQIINIASPSKMEPI